MVRPLRPRPLVLSAPLWCNSSRKCMRGLKGHVRHLLLPETNLVVPPLSPPLMVEPLRVHEHSLGGTSVAMQLCPTAASTLWDVPCLPSPACGHSSGLTGSAYRSCGEAASALHAMALLQVHQAKALRDLHEGGHDLTVLHELRAVCWWLCWFLWYGLSEPR